MVDWYYTMYILTVLFSAAVHALLAIYTWRHRTVPAAPWFFWLLLCALSWLFFLSCELVTINMGLKMVWNNLRASFAIFVVPVSFVFVVQYTGRVHWVHPRRIAVLLSIPVLTFLIYSHPNVPQILCADEARVRQVLINLLSNAIKFTQHGSVTLSVAPVAAPNPDQNDQPPPNDHITLHFRVSDTGPGISADDLDEIFKPFVQTDVGRQSQEGTGLGLAISRTLAQLMGSDLHVASVLGEGSTFWFDLTVPVVAVTSRDIPEQHVIGLEQDPTTYRVLVVDDQDYNRQVLTSLLETLGFVVCEVSNGHEALHSWQEWHPHLILMDIRMPVMDGLEVTRRIKAADSANTTHIIAVTASVTEDKRADILAAGCSEIVLKPIVETSLFASIHRCLGVDFVYDKASIQHPLTVTVQQSSVRPPSASPNIDLARLDSDILASLKEAVQLGDCEEIDVIIRERIQPHDATTAHVLETMANQFAYHEMLALIEQARNT